MDMSAIRCFNLGYQKVLDTYPSFGVTACASVGFCVGAGGAFWVAEALMRTAAQALSAQPADGEPNLQVFGRSFERLGRRFASCKELSLLVAGLIASSALTILFSKGEAAGCLSSFGALATRRV